MKRFRFSLLSLVVAVIVTGVFLWLNMTPRGPWFERGWGWPRLYWYWSDYGTVNVTTGEATHYYFDTGDLLFDAAIAIAATLLAGASAEWVIRRHRKPKRDRD